MDKKALFRVFQWLCLFLLIVTGVITLTINAYPLYVWDVSRLELFQQVTLTRGELLADYRQLLAYLNFPWIETLQLPHFPISTSGAFHFYEVKKLFLLNYAVLIVTIYPSWHFLRQLKREQGLWRLIRPFQFGFLIPIALGLVMLSSFDWFFRTFHGVFFNNEAWIFDPATDPIILVLPEQFFLHCFILAFLLLEGIFLVGILVGKRSLKK